MIPFLSILAGCLAVAIVVQHHRNARQVSRLAEALRSQDRSALGRGEYHGASSGFRELERQILEQLFEAESLEAKISRREQLLAALVDGLGDAVVVFDDALAIRLANPSAGALFGWAETPSGQRAADCIRDIELLDMVERTVVHGTRNTGELTLRSPDSSAPPRTFEVEVAPLLNTQTDSVSRARAVLHDVTDARQLEQVRKDFVANASHELRTPLTIINGYLENLMDGGVDDPETSTRFLGVMKKHGDRIARIIEDMLTISKLESERNVLQRERFDLRGCAAEVIGRLQPIIDSRQASVTIDFPEDGFIAGDPFYWDQIFFNLVENALKENESPGLNITIALKRAGNRHVIRVTDDGVGIPKAALDFIFKRFYRVDPNRSAEKKGTGLGLSIVKRAVEAHGGSIEVESSPGVSTEFKITIPAVPETLGQADQTESK